MKKRTSSADFQRAAWNLSLKNLFPRSKKGPKNHIKQASAERDLETCVGDGGLKDYLL
ncbi:hypothetical protein [Ralstonia sp. Ralssp110]|jgi:hypothetical protein|uniref:hypothetical protein n=1 Tax=Ralstonia sp. Ralssp110 TaxID=3243004 RepID=UPI0039B3C76A